MRKTEGQTAKTKLIVAFRNFGTRLKSLRSALTVNLCFSVRISEQKAITSLYNINWLDFKTEKESVYCAVRAKILNKIRVNVNLGISDI
jgi:hypothetical protein